MSRGNLTSPYIYIHLYWQHLYRHAVAVNASNNSRGNWLMLLLALITRPLYFCILCNFPRVMPTLGRLVVGSRLICLSKNDAYCRVMKSFQRPFLLLIMTIQLACYRHRHGHNQTQQYYQQPAVSKPVWWSCEPFLQHKSLGRVLEQVLCFKT